MPSCSTNSTVNSQWQVKFTIKWVSYELVSSKINQKQKSFNEFQSATGPPVNKDRGERGVGVGRGGNLTPWVIIQCFSFNTLVFFGFSISKKKKRFFFAVEFQSIEIGKKRGIKSAGFLQFLKLVLFSLWNHEDTLLHYCYSKF